MHNAMRCVISADRNITFFATDDKTC